MPVLETFLSAGDGTVRTVWDFLWGTDLDGPLGKAIQILIVVIVAVLLRLIANRVIRMVVNRIVTGRSGGGTCRTRRPCSPPPSARRGSCSAPARSARC
jgi:hypothetical protein